MHAAAPMWRNGRRNGLKIRWAIKGPCRFESGHRQFDWECRIADWRFADLTSFLNAYEKLYQGANGTTRYSRR
jgi:hypothetical protein